MKTTIILKKNDATKRASALRLTALGGLALLAACSSPRTTTDAADSTARGTTASASATAPPKVDSTAPKPAWAPDIRDSMWVVIQKLQSFNAPALETLPAEEARKQPTPTDAVMAVMKDKSIPKPAPTATKQDRTISAGGVDLPVRVYTPNSPKAAYPVIVYYHGGGFVIANLDTYDGSAQALAEKTGSVVVSVHYRQGPEHKFPTAHNDAFAAYQWVLKNVAELKGDANNMAVVGESAGGNLACNVSIMARDKGLKVPVAQVLVYPVANNDMNNASYTKYAAAKPLNKPMMAWFVKNYLNNTGESADPRISLVKANLKGLPPTLIIAAEIDPLHEEGKLLADKLRAAGVKTSYQSYQGVTHEFFGMATVLPQAVEAQTLAANFLMQRAN